MRRPQWLDDPVAPSLLAFTALILGGFVAIIIGWKIAARTLNVAFQIPPLVSGGLGGLTLVLIGTGLANIQLSRRMAAAERSDTEALIDEAGALLDAVKSRGLAR